MGTSRQTPPSKELKIFSDRLSKAIAFKKVELSVIAKNIGCAPADVKKMLSGMREPTMKKLIILANILGCSVDYLLGLTPEPQRASVVVEVDTNALKSQPSERGQTSGQISGKIEQFAAIMPELLESDVELLMYIAGFLIERKEERLSRIMDAMTSKPPKETDSLSKSSHSKNNNDELEDDDPGEEDDDLWDEIEDDEFEDDLEEDDFEDYEDDDDNGDFEFGF
jgi:transcriptional regulator with XRE-family HTH domain